MINPNRVHRAKGTVTKIKPQHFNPLNKVWVKVNGHELYAWDQPDKFKVGDLVNVQAQFSIMADAYVIKTIRKPR